MNYIKLYLISIAVFFLIDMVWLGLIAKDLYASQLGHLMSPKVNWLAAFVFYAMFIAGLVFFVVEPAVAKGSLQYAVLAGAFFGLICYATYDLTNLATLKDWPVSITLIDLAWGTFLNGAVSGAAFMITSKFLR